MNELWQRYRPLVVNLALAALAVIGGAFLYTTNDDTPFKLDAAAFAAVIWVALRGAVGLGVALLQKRPPR